MRERGLVRLNKYLMRQLRCSRREADTYIASGYVKVNNHVVTELGTKVPVIVGDPPTRQDDVLGGTVDSSVSLTDFGRQEMDKRHAMDSYATIIFHKPLGIVSCQPTHPRQVPAIRMCTSDREYRPRTTMIDGHGDGDNDNRDGDLRETGPAWYEPSSDNSTTSRRSSRSSSSSSSRRIGATVLPSPQERLGWKVAGRLDINSTGLLVLTTSGALVSQILGNTHGGPPLANDPVQQQQHRIEKEYLVRIPHLQSEEKSVIEEKLDQLREGVMSPMDKSYVDDDDHEPEGLGHRESEEELLTAVRVRQVNESQIQFVLDQGRRHHVRRMCRAVGWDVSALKRVRIGSIRLNDLPLGFWRYLRPGETFLWPEQQQQLTPAQQQQ